MNFGRTIRNLRNSNIYLDIKFAGLVNALSFAFFKDEDFLFSLGFSSCRVTPDEPTKTAQPDILILTLSESGLKSEEAVFRRADRYDLA